MAPVHLAPHDGWHEQMWQVHGAPFHHEVMRLLLRVPTRREVHGRHPVAHAYMATPISITVEGANILTRTLITFAQGALRSHPYLYDEIRAAQSDDKVAGLEAFETAFLGHVGFAVSNVTGALFHNLTGGLFASAPRGAFGLSDPKRTS